MRLRDRPLKYHGFFQCPVRCHDADAGLYVGKRPRTEHLGCEAFQSLRFTTRRPTLHHYRHVFAIEAVNLINRRPKRHQRRNDRTSAGGQKLSQIVREVVFQREPQFLSGLPAYKSPSRRRRPETGFGTAQQGAGSRNPTASQNVPRFVTY